MLGDRDMEVAGVCDRRSYDIIDLSSIESKIIETRIYLLMVVCKIRTLVNFCLLWVYLGPQILNYNKV